MYPRRDKAGAGRGRRPRSRGGGCEAQISLPWCGRPHRLRDPSLARGQVERGRGGGRAGPAPGVGPGGAGGAGPRYANVAHGRPIAGVPRAASSALSRRRPRDQSERASQRANGRGPASPERSAGPGRAARSGAAPRGSPAPAQQPGGHSATGPNRTPRPEAQRTVVRALLPAPGNAPSARRPGGARSPPGGRRPRAPLSLLMARAGARGLGC